MQNSDIASLERLRQFTGAPKEFWPLYLETAGVLTHACGCGLHVQPASPDVEAPWQRMLLWTSPQGSRIRSTLDAPAAVLAQALKEAVGADTELTPDSLSWRAFRVAAGEAGGTGVISLAFQSAESADSAAIRSVLLLLSGIPVQYEATRRADAIRQQNAELLGALDLSLLVDRQRSFLAAAMTVCNELAARLGCDRVSLGWQKEDEVLRMRAMSHAEKFESKASLVRQLELAMEECLDQESEILFPSPSDQTVCRDHAAYARETGAVHLASIPLRKESLSAGVLTCERQARKFEPHEIRQVRVALDQVSRRLLDRQEEEQGWMRRKWRWLKDQAAGFLEPRHTGAKLAVVLGSLGVLFLLIGRLPYRVSAPFAMRSDQVAFITAPFDGFVQDVAVRVGDSLPVEGVLARFDTRELLLQQASALANVNRYQQEAEKARASSDLAEMRIAQAQAEQAKAALEQTRYHLEKAELKAPFSAVVVEGDLRKRIGSSFRQGEVLFQLARVDALYVELEVSERDVHDILESREAIVAFASAPEKDFKVTLERIHPAGQPQSGGSVFLVRGVLPNESQAWWRPGMTGAAKIHVGWRNVLWILTHRTLDWIRLHFWW